MACLPKPQLSHCEMTLIILCTSWDCWEENMGKFRVFSKQVVIDNMHKVLRGPKGRGRGSCYFAGEGGWKGFSFLLVVN